MWGGPDPAFSDAYLGAELPVALDRLIREEIISELESGGASVARLCRSQRSTTVWVFGLRAASLAARTANRRWLIAGAVAGEMLGSIHQYESTTVLGCIARACSIAGMADCDALLSNVADKIGAPEDSLLRNLAAIRPLAELGIAEEWGDSFVRFVPPASFGSGE